MRQLFLGIDYLATQDFEKLTLEVGLGFLLEVHIPETKFYSLLINQLKKKKKRMQSIWKNYSLPCINPEINSSWIQAIHV